MNRGIVRDDVRRIRLSYALVISIVLALAGLISGVLLSMAFPPPPRIVQVVITPTPASTTEAANSTTVDIAQSAVDAGYASSLIGENFLDGTVVNRGQTVVKLFEVSNTGTQPWPAGFGVCKIDGYSGPSTVKFEKEVPPGEVANVFVEVTIPQDWQYYFAKSIYKVCTAAGTSLPGFQFGEEFWYQFTVPD